MAANTPTSVYIHQGQWLQDSELLQKSILGKEFNEEMIRGIVMPMSTDKQHYIWENRFYHFGMEILRQEILEASMKEEDDVEKKLVENERPFLLVQPFRGLLLGKEAAIHQGIKRAPSYSTESIRAKELNEVIVPGIVMPVSTDKHIDMEILRQAISEVRSAVVPKYMNGYGGTSSIGETSTKLHHPYVPEVIIDIPNGDGHFDPLIGNDGHTEMIHFQRWNEYMNGLIKSKFDDGAIKMISGTFIQVSGQIIGGLMVNRITSSGSSSWAGPIVEVASVLGLCVTLAGMSLRGRTRDLSTWIMKMGAATIAGAIIFSMGMHLPPVMAWTVGPVAFLIMAAAAAFA